ncbi:MAG: rRNA maturation RNase YbeY [Bacteroidetes bacterium]|jgi:probable rRNA maturation factor|nr:rRNA maturation RNase YbeY [Bacteroidota bacterium]MBT4398402.1 rRNA maturation RNase YbeY [Bacteroidota bacterium]MBT4411824.1 rRNA maturation RNase YbeY [Bacteroidota bacterium]MBT7094337.1 rRNA maturation RNase YbeY [Bacteroidota bacterium]MBT7462750.1 rRNA maturation RNase YbeY [Bacteroidota bacterium]
MAIRIYNNEIKVPVFERRKMKVCMKELVEKEGKKLGGINYIFVSDEDLLEINKKFLDHDFYTDVISFDYSHDGIVEGEIYMSIDRIIENAQKMKIACSEEIYRICVHGLLHLLSYSDGNSDEKEEMTRKENEFLENWKN